MFLGLFSRSTPSHPWVKCACFNIRLNHSWSILTTTITCNASNTTSNDLRVGGSPTHGWNWVDLENKPKNIPNGRELTEVCLDYWPMNICQYLSQLSTVLNVLGLIFKTDSIPPAGRRRSHPWVKCACFNIRLNHSWSILTTTITCNACNTTSNDPRVGGSPAHGWDWVDLENKPKNIQNGWELTEICLDYCPMNICQYLSQLSTVWNVLGLILKMYWIWPVGRRPSYPRVRDPPTCGWEVFPPAGERCSHLQVRGVPTCRWEVFPPAGERCSHLRVRDVPTRRWEMFSSTDKFYWIRSYEHK